MKFFLVLSFLFVSSQALPASKWELIRSPMEDERYQELLNKINLREKKISRVGRIVGGSYAVLGQFPYQVYGLFDSGLCGGAIVSANFVLTVCVPAGHCVYESFGATLFAGMVSRYDEASWTASVDSSNIILHPSYDNETLVNDIALLRTETIPFSEFQDVVGVVALPSRVDALEDLEGIEATVSGFGKYNDNLTTASIFLRFVDVPVISNGRCFEVFGDAITDNNLCVDGEGGRGSCQGDSGSPLTGEINGRRVLIGLVSFGAKAGCQLGFPNVFTRIVPYLDWISSHTEIAID